MFFIARLELTLHKHFFFGSCCWPTHTKTCSAYSDFERSFYQLQHRLSNMDSALLQQIQKGKKLKKAVTNDRSAPLVGNVKPSGPTAGAGGMARPPVPGMTPASVDMSYTKSAPSSAAAPPPPAPTGPQLGGLFANGMPTLRKTRGAHVDTGRGTAVPPAPPSAPVPPPPQAPAAPISGRFSNKGPETSHGTNTLPRNFKVPPIPGKASPLPPTSAPPPPPPPPPPTSNISNISTAPAGPPPAPPPPPPSMPGINVAPGVPPKTQAALGTTMSGRSRSNSSPQRPVPPPPRSAPSPPGSPHMGVGAAGGVAAAAAKFGGGPPTRFGGSPAVPPPPPPPFASTNQSNLATPPPISRTASSPATGAVPPPPAPPPPPPMMGQSPAISAVRQQEETPSATPPRSPLPPPPPTLNRTVSSRSNIPAPPPPPLQQQQQQQQQISLTEGNGRFKFRSLSDLPKPRSFTKKQHHYVSGASKGNSYPLDYSKFRA